MTDDTKFVAKLREFAALDDCDEHEIETLHGAADALEAAKAEIERLNTGWQSANALLLRRSADLVTAQAALAQPVQPTPPYECKTEAEKTAFAFGWWKALESAQPAQIPADVIWGNYCKTNEASDHFDDLPDARYLVDKHGRYLSYMEVATQPVQTSQARDAERYRWLRTYHVDSYLANGSLEKLDAECDAAINAKGGQHD